MTHPKGCGEYCLLFFKGIRRGELKASRQSIALSSLGFSLIEVVVVSALALVLGRVAIPRFLGVRDRAEARAKTAAAVGIAKECAILNLIPATVLESLILRPRLLFPVINPAWQ